MKRDRSISERLIVGLIGPDKCWEWKQAKTPSGYGVTWRNGRSLPAHRAAWEEWRGPIPEGLWVLHKCDNPGCVNPEHLFLGTNSDNVSDKVSKGRQCKGNSPKKLTADKVRQIRQSTETTRELAVRFGVHLKTVYAVLNRKTWRHL